MGVSALFPCSPVPVTLVSSCRVAGPSSMVASESGHRAAGGRSVAYDLWVPGGAGARAAAVLVHGFQGSRGQFADLAEALAQEGLAGFLNPQMLLRKTQ